MKISLIMPLYSLVSFIAIVCPGANVYLEPWLEVVQAISLSSFFLLLLEYVSPNEAERDAFFADLKIKDKKAPGGFRSGLPYMKVSFSKRGSISRHTYMPTTYIQDQTTMERETPW